VWVETWSSATQAPSTDVARAVAAAIEGAIEVLSRGSADAADVRFRAALF